MKGEPVRKDVAPPDVQFIEQLGPALSLKQRFLRQIKSALDRGGWNAIEGMLSRFFDELATDELTGLYSRRMFFMLLRQMMIPKLRRTKRDHPRMPLGSIVVTDIDRFKRINDMFGHPGGDEVLRVFSRLLKSQFREDDVVARVGGDEFIVLAVGLEEDDVEARMKEVGEEFKHTPWRIERIDDGEEGIIECFSFSYRVIRIKDPDQILQLIDQADRDVFRQKRMMKKLRC